MIKSFIEYIFESKVNGVTIYYSKRLRDFLYTIEKISTDVEVARLASALRFSENSNQMSLDITLIDLTDRNDMVSFIQANRILRKFDDKDSKPSPDSFENFEDYLKFIGIIDTSNTLWKEQRGEVGIGKFTRKVFKDNNYPVVDSVLEKFVNFFKATFDFEYNLDQKMELVKGEDIRKWYLESNYSERKGQLGNSCMRYEKCQKYLDIYVKNPEVCSLLVMYSDQNKTKICGRALIWKTTDNIHVMDRIYTVNDYDIEVFRKYAVSKEFIDTSKAFKVKKIQLKKDQVYDYYPYMDNFYIYNYKEFFLTNDSDLWPSTGYYKLQNTDGTNSSDDTVWSDYHDEWIHREDAVYCRNVRDWVLSDEAIWLDYLGIHASPAEETVYSEWGDGSYYLDDVVHSEVMNDYIPSGEIISIFVNAYGDEDYIAKDFAKNALITVDIEGEEVKTLNKFVVVDPTTGKYHFVDEKIDGVKIQDVILSKISDIEVDKEKIKDFLINNDFKLSDSKFRDIVSMYRVWTNFSLSNSEFVHGVIKYLIYAYPDKDGQRNGLPRIPAGRLSYQSHQTFKNSMLNFDRELLDKLTDNKAELLEKNSHDTVYKLTCIVQSFIQDVLHDPEIYKMWYKWKNS